MSQRTLKPMHRRFIRKSSSLSKANAQVDIEERIKAFNELLEFVDKYAPYFTEEDKNKSVEDIVYEEVMKKYESLG